MKSRDLTILFLSCDKYADLWKPLLYSFRKYWKRCPYPVCLGSNTVAFKDRQIRTVLSGPDADWSSSLLKILRQIKTPYVFLWLDDIFPIKPVKEMYFADALEFMKKAGAKHLHVEPKPWPDKILEKGKYGEYLRGAPYRVTTFGFWEVEALKSLLVPGENPWNFEIMGTYRSSYTEGYYSTMQNIIPRIHMVEKGSYYKEAYDYAVRHGIPVDPSKRSVLTNGSYLRSVAQKIVFNAVLAIPWQIRLSCMNGLRKLLVSY